MRHRASQRQPIGARHPRWRFTWSSFHLCPGGACHPEARGFTAGLTSVCDCGDRMKLFGLLVLEHAAIPWDEAWVVRACLSIAIGG